MNEIQQMILLLQENNSLLRECLAYLRKMNSLETKAENDMKDFAINVVANIVSEQFFNKKNEA